MNPLRAFFLCCAAALLLPSCVFSYLGKNIREDSQLHHAVDTHRPVDGMIYQTPEQHKRGKHSEAYILTPEYSYRRDHPLFTTSDLFNGESPGAEKVDICPTGRQLVVLVSCNGDSPGSFEKVVPALPVDARPRPAHGLLDHHHLRDIRPPDATPLWRSALAAPFDYGIDPALTATLTAIYFPFRYLWLEFTN